jgi:hypothetical protein
MVRQEIPKLVFASDILGKEVFSDYVYLSSYCYDNQMLKIVTQGATTFTKFVQSSFVHECNLIFLVVCFC